MVPLFCIKFNRFKMTSLLHKIIFKAFMLFDLLVMVFSFSLEPRQFTIKSARSPLSGFSPY